MAFLNRARFAAAVWLLANTLIVCAPPVAAQAPLEAEVKAVFLFNFAESVTCPPPRRAARGRFACASPPMPHFSPCYGRRCGTRSSTAVR